MVTTFIPVLQVNNSIVTDPQEKVAHLVRQYILSPGNTSATFNDEIISLRLHAAESSEDKIVFPKLIQASLYNKISRYFPNDNISVECSITDINDVRYNITIDIRIDGPNFSTPILYAGLINREKDGEFTINLSKGKK